METPDHIRKLCAKLLQYRLFCATAESCTGGMLSAQITSLPGASQYFMGGLVAYNNSIKTEVLGLDPALLQEHGAVSEAAALAMAEGACKVFGVSTSMAITGIAGPGGASPEKPLGLVWIATACDMQLLAMRHHFSGSRDDIRQAACKAAALQLFARL